MTTISDYPQIATALNQRARYYARYKETALMYVVGEGVQAPAPGWYEFLSGDAFISIPRVFGDQVIDDATVADEIMKAGHDKSNLIGASEEARVLIGLSQHEFAHSVWSEWMADYLKDMAFTSKGARQIAIGLEELRIEGRAMGYNTQMVRIGIRSVFRKLILNEEVTPETAYDMAYMWLLTYGRVATTIVARTEVDMITSVLRTILEDEVVDELVEIIDEAIDLNLMMFSARQRFVKLCDRWVELVGEPSSNFSDEMLTDTSGAEGEPSDKAEETEEAEGDPKSGGVGEKPEDENDDIPTGSGDRDSMAPDADPIDNPQKPITDEASKEMFNRALKDMLSAVEQDFDLSIAPKLSDPVEMSNKVFGGKRRNVFDETDPTEKELIGVQVVANRLSKISYHAPSTTLVSTSTPPGRFRGRDAVQMSAERAQGRMTTAKPWEKKKRQRVHNPPLTVGIATDVSGSMAWAEPVVASAAYVLANAVVKVSGKVAAVTFGDRVDGVLAPGERPTTIRTRSANGGCEEFDKAMAALDGVMHFRESRGGAKLIICITDGIFVNQGEGAKLFEWSRQLTAAGVAQVWISQESDDLPSRQGPLATRYRIPKEIQLVGLKSGGVDGFTEALPAIVDAIEKALQAATV